MSRHVVKMLGAVVASGVLAITAVMLGVHSLGASDELTAALVVVTFVCTMFLASFIPLDPPTDRR